LNPDTPRPFSTQLCDLLGTEPTALEWPREFTIQGDLPAVFDPHNALLTIYGARTRQFAGNELRSCLTAGAEDPGICSRVLVFAQASEPEEWTAMEFANEGTIDGYWADGHAAHLWAKAWSERAGNSAADDALIENPPKPLRPRRPALPRGWVCRPADTTDAGEIGGLLRQVFPAYPIPEDPGAIRYALAAGLVHGRVVRDQAGALAAYASAEFQPGGGAAEITDCATAPATRGRGLMTHLVARLQEDLADIFESRHAYCLAREDQPGMQLVLARRGWRQAGRLVRHYRVGGRWLSAWLWQA